jgi:uncharacterized protein YktA (UPF0223 family)
MTRLKIVMALCLFFITHNLYAKPPALSRTDDPAKALAVMWTVEGNVQQKYNQIVEKKLKEIGFILTDPHKRVNDQYKTKYGSTVLDVLSFMPISNDDNNMPLFNIDPRLAGFSPFNMLIYKEIDEKNTHIGHLTPEAMIDIVGITDPEVKKKFIASFKALDTIWDKAFGEDTKSYIAYHNTTKDRMINFEYTFERDEDFDIDDFIDEFQNKFELSFIEKHYLIAGYHNFLETDNGEEMLEGFDTFWTYSLCHLTYSYNVFDTQNARPDAGLYAPCTMYVYIQKDSNKMVIGMPKLANVKNTLHIKDPKRVGWMNKLDIEIPQILTAMGMQAVTNVNPLKDTPKPIKIDMTPTGPVPGTINGKFSTISAPEIQTKAPKIEKKPEPNVSPVPTIKEKSKEQTIENGGDTVHIIIPKPPKVPTPVKVSTENADALNSRTIKFSKRVPPGYIPLEKRISSTNPINTTTKIGEVDKGRIATYLRAPLISVDEAKKNLEKAGFQILAEVPLDKKKELTVLVFTDDTLEKFAVDNGSEFLASLRLLVDKRDNHITITNPLYMAKAFIQKPYKEKIPKETLAKITKNFKGLINSKEKLKYQMLPKYQFMNGMPRYKDMVEVAMGDDLLKNIQGKKQVVFQQKLPNGAVLFGMTFKNRTQKFPYRIGTNNAALLPYPVLIKNGKAYIMDPKYYISVMYPLLKMSEFMTIATVPDAILKETQRVFRKKK